MMHITYKIHVDLTVHVISKAVSVGGVTVLTGLAPPTTWLFRDQLHISFHYFSAWSFPWFTLTHFLLMAISLFERNGQLLDIEEGRFSFWF